MARILIFTTDDGNGLTYHEVYRDSSDPTIISAKLFEYLSGQPLYPTYTDGQIVGFTCVGTTMTGYKYKSTLPLADYFQEYNSVTCGFVPSCDIAIQSFATTDETASGANDGTANLFCSTSFGPVYYQLIGMGVANNIGYFTGIPPGDYYIEASDAHECIINQPFTIHAFDTSRTHYKYRLKFNSVRINDIWEVRLLDMFNSYDSAVYPIDLEGTEVPLLIEQGDPNEDKTTPIISKNVTINLLYDGLIFTVDEFATSQERQWKIEVYRNASLEFQGWLLADETQNLYADPSYAIALKATDGLPSLKGNVFGDGSGGNGYSNSQFAQYGVTTWALLVKQCLDQLGYDYSDSILLSSLQYNNAYDENQWCNFGTWSDILYDANEIAVDTYSALELLLTGLKLCLFQDKGQFIFVNWNDILYVNNSAKSAQFKVSLFQIADSFTTTTATGAGVRLPLIQNIGFSQPIIPINPQQSLNYDKAYNMTAKIDFSILALLYENPSFELNPIQGDPPSGFTVSGLISAYLNHDVTAYLGEWVLTTIGYVTFLRTGGPINDPVFQINGSFFFMNSDERSIFSDPGYIIDQPNKKVNFSFQWRPVFYSTTQNVVPTVYIIFEASATGKIYMYSLINKDSNNQGWFELEHPRPFAWISQRVSDYQGWNSTTILTDALPDGGIGTLRIGFRTPLEFDGTPILDVTTNDRQIDYDDFQVTLADATEQYSLQVGETHTVTSVTGIPRANNKPLDFKLFTYPPNKRIAGNIFSGDTYTTDVQNLWSFNLKTADVKDRLPATIIKSIGRNYQRPFRIFEGDVETYYLSYYGVFILEHYEDNLFMPFSIQLDPRNEVGHIIMVEISDDDQQAIYLYSPTFEKTARRVINN